MYTQLYADLYSILCTAAVCLLHARSSCFPTDAAYRGTAARRRIRSVEGRRSGKPVSRTEDPEFYELLVQDNANDKSTDIGYVDDSQHLTAAAAMPVTNIWHRSSELSIK